MASFDCAVVFSHLRYDGVRQRPHHLVERLARRLPVLFVEEPLAGATQRDDITPSEGTPSVLRPRRLDPSAAIDEATIAAIRIWVGGRSALGWFYAPMMLEALDLVPFARVAFDSMDDLASFRFAPPSMLEREAELVRRVDVVFAGGRSLFERLGAAGDKVKCYPSGVDIAHFSRAALPGAIVDPLLRPLRGPVFGYAGVIDERIDLSIFDELARRGGDVVAVGPFAKIDVADLPGGPRIHYTGIAPYARLPELYAGFDVALMPFAIGPATEHLSPTKTPEYLAAGRPVVSTGIGDVARTYGDVVDVVGRELFVDRAFERAAHHDSERAARGAAAAARSSWDAIADSMWDDLRSGQFRVS